MAHGCPGPRSVDTAREQGQQRAVVLGMGPGLRCGIQSQVSPLLAGWPESAPSGEHPPHRGVRGKRGSCPLNAWHRAWPVRSGSNIRDFINSDKNTRSGTLKRRV